MNNKPALSQCVNDAIQPGGSATRAFEVTKRIAWLLRGEKAGLLIKNGGENTIEWQGYSFSISRICYPDGHIFKVVSDAGEGGTNGATWDDNGFVDSSLYVPAIDPSKPEPEALALEPRAVGPATPDTDWVAFVIDAIGGEPARPARRPDPLLT